MNKPLIKSIGLVAFGFVLSQPFNHFYAKISRQDYVNKNFAVLCKEGSDINREITELSYSLNIKRIDAIDSKSAPKLTKEDQLNSSIINDLESACIEKYWATKGDFDEHWAKSASSAKERLLAYGIKNDDDVVNFLEEIQ